MYDTLPLKRLTKSSRIDPQRALATPPGATGNSIQMIFLRVASGS